MEHKVLMMGGRRAGKSSILASILYNLQTESSKKIKESTGFDVAISQVDNGSPYLVSKSRETAGYIIEHRDMGKNAFTVDVDPTPDKAAYKMNFVLNSNANVGFEFVDVPGEWMRTGKTEEEEIIQGHKKLIEEIKVSDVFVIAIDTPYLMQESDDPQTQQQYDNINKIYNRVDEIIDSLEDGIRFGGEEKDSVRAGDEDKKLIMLCPVKCEKWARNNGIEKVSSRVKVVYDRLFTRWGKDKRVIIKIMPIQTAGGLESAYLLPAKFLYKSPEQTVGLLCSKDPNTGMIMLSDGLTLRPNDNYELKNSDLWKIDGFRIPLSWYKVNGIGYLPKFCEQTAFHIIEFLLKKEEDIIKARAQSQRKRLDEMNWFERFFTQLFRPTFGVYLPKFRDFVDKLNDSNLIKRSGDGFETV